MRKVVLSVSKNDKKWIEGNLIDIQYIADFFTTVLNQVRPVKKSVTHRLKIIPVDCAYSYYDFSESLFIAKKNSDFKGKQQKLRIIEDLFHEFGHYVQHKIDRLPVARFAVDHEETSYTSYFKNKTEVQARSFGRLAKVCLESLTQIRKIKRHLQKL